MARGATIGRMMVAVALIAAAFGLGVSWAGPAWTLGELAPMAMVGLIGLALAVVTSGRIRRCFGGMAMTGVVLSLAFWIAPPGIRSTLLTRILWPLDQRFGPRPKFVPTSKRRTPPVVIFEGRRLVLTRLLRSNTRPLWIGVLFPSRSWGGTTRNPFNSREAQLGLGLLQLTVATTGGLIAAIPRSRAARNAVIVPQPTRSELP